MKKLLIFLILLVPFLVKAQYPTKQKMGNDSSLMYAPGAISTTGGFINGRYTDTAAANLTRIRQYPGAQIVTGDTKWLRNWNATAWIQQASGNGNNGGSGSSCGFANPGYVIWDSLLVFTVTPSTYQLCCDLIIRYSATITVTLAAAHATLPRFDGIFLDSTGVVVVTGTAASAPAQPQPNGCQKVLTYILVPAASTTPSGITSHLIYDENVQLPDEWNTSNALGQNVDPDQSPVASRGYKSVYFNDAGENESIVFTTIPQISPLPYSNLYFKIKYNSFGTIIPNGLSGVNVFFTGSDTYSQNILVTHGSYGFDSTDNDWQLIVIPLSAFNFGGRGMDSLESLFMSASLFGGDANFYIDEVNLQGGVNQENDFDYFLTVSTQNGVVTATQPRDNVTFVGANGISTSASGKTVTISGTSTECGFVNPGYVTWDSLLVFTVSPARYQLCCDLVVRTTELTQITLSAADPTLARFDMIALDSTGVIVVEGTPAADPAQPQPNGCQKLLTYILIGGGSTTPDSTGCGNVARETIYDETGGTEWTPSANGGLSASFTDTDYPYHLTKDADLATLNSGQSISFLKGSTITLTDYTTLKFYIRLKSALHNRLSIAIFFNNSTDYRVTAPVILTTGQYNFDRTVVGSYQEITIPVSAFLAFNSGAPSTTVVDQLYFLAQNQNNADGIYIDYIQLQSGICQPPNTANGTVTSFSAGNLLPLFTTNVANPTTTPQLTFTQSSAAANTYYGVGGTAGVPSFLPVSNIRGQVVTILSDTTFQICSSDAVPVCDTFTVNTVDTIQIVRIISDTEIEVCGNSICDTLTVTTTTIGQPITADNGLTMSTPSNVQLGSINNTGSPLLHNSYINTLDKSLIVRTTTASANPLYVEATTGIATYGIATSGRGILGAATTGVGVYGSSTGASGYSLFGWSFGSGGVGAYVRSDLGIAVDAIAGSTVTNTVIEGNKFSRYVNSGVGADGIGQSMGFYTEADNGGTVVTNEFVSRLTTAALGSYVSEFSIKGVDNAVSSTLFTLAGSGKVTLNKYTGTTFRSVDTTTYKPLMVSTADGNVMTGYWAGSGGSLGTQSKSAFWQLPASGDTIVLWYTTAAITISSITSVNTGGSDASVTWQAYQGSSRASGTAILSGSATTTSISTAETDNTFNDATVPSGYWIWIVITAGTGTGINFTINYTND